ncbi:hypothetical protein SAMN05720766_10975 [Fibrobacter sp. UWH9]|nr:hypothetical protein SAMN05720766_10975 [Fibrobacter sp. UWH9]
MKWLIVAFLLATFFLKNQKRESVAEVDSVQNKKNVNDFSPNFEIKYEDSEGNETLRQIFAKKIDGQVLTAHCFLRDEERSFYIPRITECVDLETGEIVTNDIKRFLLKKFKQNVRPCDVYRYEEWVERSYNKSKPVSENVGEFDINQKLRMTVVTYKEGEIQGEFLLEKVRISSYEIDGLYVVLLDENGDRHNVGLSKVISAEGIGDFTAYIENSYYQSDNGKVQRLLMDYNEVLSILIYLGRADASLTAKKRAKINEYMILIGADCTEDLIAKVSRRIKLELTDYKKIVNKYAKEISENQKKSFKETAEYVVGGREKAKPFGMAGLQYLDSKMKWC